MLANLIGQILDDKYQIETELGKGGMGSVYLATHIGTERPVAVKVIAPEFMKNEEFVERFRREARAAGRMRHPNVVDVTDFGFALIGKDRVAYLVMEYLDGCTLAEVICEELELPLSWVTDILEQTCSAVDEAHRNGIVHRDLKPDNIWLEPNCSGGYTVKVLDFGIAKLCDASPDSPSSEFSMGTSKSNPTSLTSLSPSKSKELFRSQESPTILQGPNPGLKSAELEEAGTRILSAPTTTNIDEPGTLLMNGDSVEDVIGTRKMTTDPITGDNSASVSSMSGLTRVGSILGTPLYMSPEQCKGEHSDSRSDIYSLGVIAYQMLAGKTPFQGDLATVIKAHIELEPPALDRKRVPKRVAGVLMSALAKNPNDRPATAAGFASELKAYSEGGFSLIRRAMTIYIEHLPVFVGVSALVYLPIIAVTVISLTNNYFLSHDYLPMIPAFILKSVIGLVHLAVSFFSVAVLIGVITRLVTQLFSAPLRPLSVRPAFLALRKRAKKFFPTTMLFNVMTLGGLVLCVIPGLFVLINYSLVAPVLMMEDISGRAALRRAKSLAKRSRRTVTLILFLQFVVPIIVSAVLVFVVSSVIKAFDPAGMKASLIGISYQILFLPISILFAGFSAILTALLYLKMKQAGGEALKDAVERIDEDELPRTKWQMRIRERTRVTTRVGS